MFTGDTLLTIENRGDTADAAFFAKLGVASVPVGNEPAAWAHTTEDSIGACHADV